MSKEDTICKMVDKTEDGELVWTTLNPEGTGWKSQVRLHHRDEEYTFFELHREGRSSAVLTINDKLYATMEKQRYELNLLITQIEEVESNKKQAEHDELEERFDNW